MAEHIKHSPPAAVNIDIPISKKISKKSLPRQNNKKRNPQKKKNTKLIRPINSSQVDLPSTGTFPATIVSNLSYWLKNAHCTRQRCRPSFFFFFFFIFLSFYFFISFFDARISLLSPFQIAVGGTEIGDQTVSQKGSWYIRNSSQFVIWFQNEVSQFTSSSSIPMNSDRRHRSLKKLREGRSMHGTHTHTHTHTHTRSVL